MILFTVLNSYRDNDTLLYAVRDFASGQDLEVITEEELKLLISMNLEMKDINDNIITLSGDTLNIQVDDITDQINESLEEQENDDDDYDDIYAAYAEDDSDEVDDNEEYDDSSDYDFSDYDDIYAAYEDEEPEGSVVSKLYENLSEEQIKILKRYYLWYSQRLFNDAQKDPTLGLKDQKKIQAKKSALNQLRGNGEWRYAGFLDTGSIYAGYTCTLGHALRYMHLAWDITVGDIETCFFGEDYNIDFEDIIRSNNCIVYGIKCIGDFFEVDSECIKNLQRAQRESLRDMAIMYEFYINNTVEDTKSSFKFMDEVVGIISKKDIRGRTLKKDYVPVLPFSVSAFYTQFRENDMIPPKSLVQTIRSCMVGWTNGEKYFSNKWTGRLRYPEESFIKDVLPIALNLRGEDKELLNFSIRDVELGYRYKFIDCIKHYLYIAFTYEICGVYKYDAENNKDEGGRSRQVRDKLALHYNYSVQNIFDNLEFSIDTCVKLLRLNKFIAKFENSYSSSEFPVEIVLHDNSDVKQSYYLCALNQMNLVDAINEFDKSTGSNLYDILVFLTELNRELRRSTRRRYSSFNTALYSTDGNFDLDKLYPIVEDSYNKFFILYEKFLTFIEERNNRYIDNYNKKIEQERIEKENREQERLKQEEIEQDKQGQYDKFKDIDTPLKLAKYLSDNMNSYNLDKSWDLSKNIVGTVIKSDKEPSSRQLYHLKRLFKEITGVEYTGVGSTDSDKIQLNDRQDLKDAIDFILNNESLVDDCITYLHNTTSDNEKFKSVLNSIVKFGKISQRQMVYAEAAKKVYDLNK